PLTDLAIMAQIACIEAGRTRDGYTLSEAFSELQSAGADIAGLNCRLGPGEILRAVTRATIPEDLPISVFPNAGRLGVTEGEFAYTSSTQYFASRALLFREQGVRIIGGCCGTSPEHIKAIAEALANLPPLPRINPPPETVEALEPRPSITIERPTTIVERVKTEHVVLVEFDPPKDLDIESYLQGAAVIQEAGADFITMADNSLAQTRMSNLALGAILKTKMGINPLLHITCRDRNLIGQQSHLMGLHALGIDHVLVVTGDPTRFGDLPGASSVFDVSSFDLIRMVKQLNNGVSFAGAPLKQKAHFVVGAAFNPHAAKIDNAIARLEKKIEAGADFIMTQPVYDQASIELIYERTRHLPVPIFLGIMPLTSLRNAEYLHNEVPGIRLSDGALKRMAEHPTGESARQEGIAMAKELVDSALPCFNGLYLITPFSYHAMSSELTKYIRNTLPESVELGRAKDKSEDQGMI
ncbi:MAG: bifunctional homocysteine S-methyltransferase/methylenetetrahydrofolate reductase, partial [Candidatus Saccharibacteria bacterium]